MTPGESELWVGPKQRVSAPNCIAVAAAAQNSGRRDAPHNEDVAQPAAKRTRLQRRLEAQAKAKAAASQAEAKSTAKGGAKGGASDAEARARATANLPDWWLTNWAPAMKHPDTGKLTGFCHQFQSQRVRPLQVPHSCASALV